VLSVFSNLLSNAVRCTPPGGTARLRQGEAWAAVRDTGIGIAPEALEHIFETFYRSPDGRAVESLRLGPGPSPGRQLVQAHGEWSDVTGQMGAGSTFRV
jgi:signal transduction histidine kinase